MFPFSVDGLCYCSGLVAFTFRYVLEEKVLEIEIEPGMKDGYNYPFIAEGIYGGSYGGQGCG